MVIALLLGILFATPVRAQSVAQDDVSIQARVLEVDASDFILGPPTQGVSGDDVIGFARTVPESAARSLSSSPRSKTLQNLQVTASRGKPTQLRIGSRTSASGDSADFLEASVLVEITCRAPDEQRLPITVAARIQLQSRSGDATGSVQPIFSSQEFNRVIAVANGETLIVGGFLSDEDRRRLVNIPALKDSSILGYLFPEGQGARHELVVMLTPHFQTAGVTSVAPVKPAPPVKTEQPPPPAPPVQTQQAERPTVRPPSQNNKRPRYTLQVGAFQSQANAANLSAELSKRYADVSVRSVPGGTTPYHVQVGLLPDLRAARQLQTQLRKDGFSAFVVPLD